ncbi:MAG: hypothetical protein ACLTJ5_09405 [Clostridium sp.]
MICYESEEEKFQPLDAKKKVVMKTFEEVAKEEKERAQEETGDESFQEGLPVTNYDEVIEEKIQKKPKKRQRQLLPRQNNRQMRLSNRQIIGKIRFWKKADRKELPGGMRKVFCRRRRRFRRRKMNFPVSS